MADKFFIATCEKKVSKHPVKDGKSFTLPVKAGTQQEAKEAIRQQVEIIDPSFEESGKTYADWYKGPTLEKVSEEDYNKLLLETESSLPESNEDKVDDSQLTTTSKSFPQLGDDGFFNSKDPEAITSSFIYNSTDEHMQAAKVFILNVGVHKWAFGFRYKNGDFDHHEKMNLDKVVDNKEKAIDSAINRLESFCDIRDEFEAVDSERPFLSAVMTHDFYHDFLESSELFIDAVSKHPDAPNAVAKHKNYYEVVEGHFADVWPLDQSPEQAIEHVMSMETIGILYDLEAFTEIMKIYMPISLTNATKQSMERIENVIDKPAANEPTLIEPCWKAAIPLTEDLHIVIAIKDCGDEGWVSAFEGNLKSERVFGDADDYGDGFSATRKEAIKHGASQVVNALYIYDTTYSLAKAFAKSPYYQDFEDNCVQLGVEESDDNSDIKYPKILNAIVERLSQRISEPTSGEISICYEMMANFVTEDTNIDALVVSIKALEKCNILFNEEQAKDFVLRVSRCQEPNHNRDNEYECIIADALASVGEPDYFTTETFAEAGEKLKSIIDESVDWFNGEREVDGKFSIFDREKTLENIKQVEWGSASEISKAVLNIRSVRGLIRSNIAFVENKEDETHGVELPSLLEAISVRLENENHAVTPERAHTHLLKVIKNIESESVQIDIDALCSAIGALKNPVIIWHSTESVNLVMKCTTDKKSETKEKQEDKKDVVNNESKSAGEIKETATEDSKTESDDDDDSSDSDVPDDSSEDTQNVVSLEAANDEVFIPNVDLDTENENLYIWNQAFKTDLKFTKPDASSKRLSINAQYRQMRATDIFGARGCGWGVDIVREWLEDGMPIIANGQVTGVNESIHNIEIELWYIHPLTGEKCTLRAYGETERWYWSHNYGRMIKNGEIRKKSLTDATGKALSMLGICGDVYMGEYDDESIQQRSEMVKLTDNAIKSAEFDDQTRQAALDKAKSYTDKFDNAGTLAEIKRLQKLAKLSLDGFPTTDKETKAKKQKALNKIDEQADAAIAEFNSDEKAIGDDK